MWEPAPRDCVMMLCDHDRARRAAGRALVEKSRPFDVSQYSPGAVTAPSLPDGIPVVVAGREAQILRLLARVGPAGFTAEEAAALGWARRPSAYIHSLRRRGIPIQTSRERTSDGATVARYAFAGPVAVAGERGPGACPNRGCTEEQRRNCAQPGELRRPR